MVWFRRGRGQFRTHELAVLDAVRAQLTPEAASILDAQIGAVAMVQRLQDGREVNTYPWRFRRPEQETGPTFPSAGQEVRLATVKVVGAHMSARAVVWLVHGHFFSIGFNKPPRSLGDVRVQGVTMEIDPMKPSGEELTEQQLTAELAPDVRAEYEALIRGRVSGDQTLLPPDELYGIDISGSRFVVVAALDGDGVIAARSGGEGVARFTFGDDTPEVYPTLQAAMDALRLANRQQSR
jgi:hypothetical protein